MGSEGRRRDRSVSSSKLGTFGVGVVRVGGRTAEDGCCCCCALSEEPEPCDHDILLTFVPLGLRRLGDPSDLSSVLVGGDTRTPTGGGCGISTARGKRGRASLEDELQLGVPLGGGDTDADPALLEVRVSLPSNELDFESDLAFVIDSVSSSLSGFSSPSRSMSSPSRSASRSSQSPSSCSSASFELSSLSLPRRTLGFLSPPATAFF